MGELRSLTSEKTYSYDGVFDIKETYSFLKSFLEDSKGYDVTEKEFIEKNDSGSKKIEVSFEAEQEYTDYFKGIIKFKLVMSGKEVIVKDPITENSKSQVSGNAKLVLNTYIEVDHMGKRPKGPLTSFLEKVYSNYFDRDEFGKVAGHVSSDASELIGKFKQSVNISV